MNSRECLESITWKLRDLCFISIIFNKGSLLFKTHTCRKYVRNLTRNRKKDNMLEITR